MDEDEAELSRIGSRLGNEQVGVEQRGLDSDIAGVALGSDVAPHVSGAAGGGQRVLVPEGRRVVGTGAAQFCRRSHVAQLAAIAVALEAARAFGVRL